MAYPVSVAVEPQVEHRNRLTVGFRLILSIPHAILVGPVFGTYRAGSAGLLGAVAYFLAIVNWFAILFTGSYPAGVLPFGLGVMRWTLRVEAYMLLLTDEYPPFAIE